MNNRSLICLALATSASLITSQALADRPYDRGYKHQDIYDGWSFGVNLDRLNLKEDAANREDIQLQQEADVLGVSAEYFTSDSDMTYAVGLNFISYGDNNPFFYEHHSGWYEQSDAHAFMVYGEAGPRFRIGGDGMTFVSVKMGLSSIFGSERSVDCDCVSEELNLDGGVYGSLGLGHSFGWLDVSVNFQQYFTGDLDNSLGLKFATSF
jgi:hypothetical protein